MQVSATQHEGCVSEMQRAAKPVEVPARAQCGAKASFTGTQIPTTLPTDLAYGLGTLEMHAQAVPVRSG